MTEPSTFQKIINNIQENYLDCISLTKTRFKINGSLKKDLSSLVEDKEFLKEAGAAEYFVLDDKQQANLMSKVSEEVRRLKKPSVEISSDLPETALDYNSLIPCIDVNSNEDYLMFNLKTGWLSDITYKAWRMGLNKDQHDALIQNKRFITKNYQPYSLEKYVEKDYEGSSVLEVNSCVHPDWRYVNKDVEISDLFEKFFKGLFTSENSMVYAVSWIYETIYGRNGTYLVLNGRKGIGKNILAQACSKMVGVRNYVEAPRSALSKEFNTYLKDKRLVLMDEISFRDNKEKDKLKSYLNTFQAVEGKGKDSKMIELYCSIILSSNTAKDCNIEPDDRRFSVMDLSQSPLLQTLGEENIERLVDYIESDDFPLAFNSFLERHRDKNYNPNKPYIGESFNELCISTLKIWQSSIYDAVNSRERDTYILKDIMTPETRDFFPKRFNDYTNFLSNFSIDGHYLGTFERGETILTSEIKPSEHFKSLYGDNLE